MDSTQTPRKARSHRLPVLAGAAALTIVVVVGCGAKVAVDRDGGLIGTGGSGGAGGGWSNSGAGAGSGTSGSGAKDGGCGINTVATGGGQWKILECFAMPEDGCPKQYDAPLFILPNSCMYLVSVDCGPVVVDDQCCYEATEESKPCTGG